MEGRSGGGVEEMEDEPFRDLLRSSWLKRGLEPEEGEGDRAVRRKVAQQANELKVLVGFKEGHDIGKIGLIALTVGLKKVLGEVDKAFPVRGGKLLIQCRNSTQRDKALKLQSVCKLEVSEARLFGERRLKGVISGIPLGEKLEDLKKVMKGGTIVSVKRLQANRNGERVDSTSVLLEFQESVLPERVMVGYMSFSVREYVPGPVRCYKCQRYGHIAKVCRGKQRCGKCGGDHEYGQCGDSVVRKCCNCGGDHTAAYGGCPVRKKAVAVQQVRSSRNLSYADAVNVVQRESDEGSQQPAQAHGLPPEAGGTSKENVINPEKLLLFIAYVVNCSDDLKSKTDKIKMIVKAAYKFLNIGNVSWERIQDALAQGEMNEPSQAQA